MLLVREDRPDHDKTCSVCPVEDNGHIIPEIEAVQPGSPVRINDAVVDARGVLWLIAHYYNFFTNKVVIEFRRPDNDLEYTSADICWCGINPNEHDDSDHIDSDPHGPFRRLYVEEGV